MLVPMPAAIRSDLLKRVPPQVWIALVWGAVTVYEYIEALFQPSPLPGLHEGFTDRNLILLGPATLMVLGMVWLRGRPLVALWLLLGATLVVTMDINSVQITFPQFLPVDVAVCFLAATRSRRVSVAAIGSALFVLAGYATARHLLAFRVDESTAIAVGLTTVVAWLIGNSIRQNHQHADALRAQAAAQAITAERLRIARELHDMVAHSIGIIAIQAGVGRRVIGTQPAEARNALDAIEATSRETLGGLRRLVGGLRRTDPGATPGGHENALAPGLADVGALADAARDAGVHVDVEWSGAMRPLPPDLDLSAYRIVQEAVTNVVRHAGADRCRIRVEHRDGAVALEIVDDGAPQAVPGPAGFGLTGMRERVALLRGEFAAGPRPGGGFRVAAVLPVPSMSTVEAP